MSTARRFVVDRLAESQPEVREVALLLVSELATNSVRHARTPFTVSVQQEATGIRIGVGDQDRSSPRLRSPGVRDLSGRGIAIVAKLADDWGIEPTADGKCVWFTLSPAA